MKKRNKILFKIIALALVMSFSIAEPVAVYAKTSEELEQDQKKLEQEEKALEKQKKDLEKQSKDSQNKLNSANSKIGDYSEAKEDTQEAIDETNTELVGLMADIEMIKEDIAYKEELIDKTQKEYDEAKEHEETLYAAMVQRVKYMYEKGNLSYVQILLTATSYSDALNKVNFVENLYEYDRIKLAEYVAAKEAAQAYGEQLEGEKAELETSQYELEQEQEYMEELLAQYKATYADYEVKIAKAKQDAAVYTAQIKSQQSGIASLQKQIEAKQKEVDEAKKATQEAKAAEDAAKAEAEGNGTGNTDVASGDSGQISGGSGSSGSGSGSSKSYSSPGSLSGSNVASYACQFVGNPYVAGGTSLTNGADCSGFVQSVYKAFGVSVPRTSWAQGSYGREVSYSDAQPGDVIYYGGHVGIYIGGGQIVHASTQKTGIKYSPATYRSIISVRRFI
ncbi:NLPC/P60 domain-containing protein [Butyrivibrio proteoclasticus B316]|uniref:NLPC/P60 domain-containing protein n=1 Tax=Butyrivibrio proteoclasticus (strain ATCC 51982 / DSM 14932 / B316) TaxID=515622 RepID=E0RZU6_BUTPB|nr:C40 family peptidase [Butyrivibrio proteoclasticus]ADL35512.1 NLPC/P60 domain-containing protein [Butyrivibrio proteoclasticus B316]